MVKEGESSVVNSMQKLVDFNWQGHEAQSGHANVQDIFYALQPVRQTRRVESHIVL